MDEDLEEIRKRKIQRIQRKIQEKKLEEERRQRERHEREEILGQVLTPEAYEYLSSLRSSSPQVASKIEEILLALVIQRRIRYRIDRIIIRAIERKVRGIEPTITFMRKGRKIEISEKLREAD